MEAPLSDDVLCGSTPADRKMPSTVSACSWNNASLVVSLSAANSSKRNTFIGFDPYADRSTLGRDVCKP